MFFAFDQQPKMHLQVHALVVGGPGKTSGAFGFA